MAQSLGPAPGASHLYLVPTNTHEIRFLTHIVEVEVVQNNDLTVQYNVISTYRLHNIADEIRIVALNLRSSEDTLGEVVDGGFGEIQLYEGTIAVPLEPLPDGQYRALVSLEPDERIRLDLHYGMPATSMYFPEVIYNFTPLRIWGDPPESMRLSVYAEGELDQRRLQKVAPANYEKLDGEVRWHFENAWPWTPLQLRFIHQAHWDLIRQAMESGNQLALGRLYHVLYMVSSEQPLSESQIFYDQALASLLQAVEQDPGQAHYSLAQLYRSQLLQVLRPGHITYLEQALHHGRLSLQLLPLEFEIERRDLTRWLIDGLGMQIALATQRKDWVTVNEALAEVETLPSDFVNREQLEEIRQNVTLQQAIGLLDSEAVAEAVALAESSSGSTAHLPPPETVPLFQSWLTSVEANHGTLNLTMEGSVDPAQAIRLSAKLALLESLTTQAGNGMQLTWDLQEFSDEVPIRRVLQLHILATDETQAQKLAQLLGTDADWMLLKQILWTHWPQVTVHNQLLTQDLVYEYSLNLDDVFRLWNAKAQTLEQEAIREASVGSDSPEDVVRQFNYVNSAQAWRNLAANSVVLVSLESEAKPPAHTSEIWVATLEDPLLQARSASHALRLPTLAALGSFLLVLLLGIATWLNSLLRAKIPLARMRRNQTRQAAT